MMADGVDNAANMEAAKLSAIFPNEIWLQIMERIFDPKDLHRIFQSSPFFDKLFEFIKTKVLFPEVIKIFAAKSNRRHKDVLLKCRLVCRTWALGVDLLLNSFFDYRNLFQRPNTRNAYIRDKELTTLRLGSEYDTSRFFRRLGKKYTTKNWIPFICRSVHMQCTVDMSGENSNQQFVSSTLKILGMYGHNVSRLSLRYDQSVGAFATTQYERTTTVSFFEGLSQFLNLMPNLKVLELTCDLRLNKISKDQLEELELSMRSCALPALNNLRHVEVQNLPTPVLGAVLRDCSNVTMLSLCNNFITANDLLLFVQPMPNLTQLELAVENNLTLIPMEISNVTWPLTTLLLRIKTAVFDWEKLFRILENRWPATLTELQIKVDYVWKRPPYNLPTLNLPNVKVFWFYSQNVVSLDFILAMANTLEGLVVQYNSQKQGEALEAELQNEQVIKFYKFRKNLMNSNIWTLLPKLKFVEYYDTEVGLYPHPNRSPYRRVNKR